MSADAKTVTLSNNAIESVMAALSQDPRKTTAEEEAFDAAVDAAVVKPGGHVEVPSEYPARKRMYSVTTIAAAKRYGGTRTVMICDSFELARQTIEEHGPYWWEHSYMLAVIEEFHANVPYGGMFDRPQYWYRYTWDKGAPPGEYPNAHYEAIERPAGLRAGEFAVG